jgi:cell surface protein SprA
LASNQINPKKRLANAYIKLDPIEVGGSYPPSFDTLSQTNDPGESTEGYFVLLDESQYKFDHFGGFIALATNVNDNQAIAVAYRIQNDNQQAVDNLQFGEFHDDTTGTLILKLVKPAVSLTRAYRTAWNLQLRNIYSLGGKDLKKEGFSLRAYFKPVDADTTNELKDVSLLRLLGIDQYDDAGAPLANGDGRFDFIPKLTVDVDRAEIIFPTLEPFDEGLARNYRAIKNENFPDSLQFTELYDTARTTARNNSLNAAYQIAVTSSTSRSSRIGLGSFNIVEGSVQVLMDGIPLQPNIDYTVDYIIGEVVIKNEQALVPGRNLEIKYEQNDLFQLAAKTLIGARGEIDVAQNSKLGFTIMNLNQETLSDKVRIGEEPTNNTMFGVDGSTMFELPIVTKALDAVPLLRATEMSSLRLGGEGAYMLPDPNTKKSPIESDQGASIAYIDDFEGARRTIPFNITYYSWRPASPPMDSFPSDNNFRRQFREKTFAKAKLSWYNNTREYDAIPIHEIWPNRSVRTGQDFAPVLHLDFQPGTRGMYNFSTNLDSTLGSPSDTAPTNTDLLRRNWNGVMRYISTTAGNLIEQNVNYLEIWIKATSSDINDLRRGRLFINLGSISEDVLEYGKLNSEDIISTSSNPTGVPNNVLNPDEDVGIDMLSNAGEKSDESIKEFLNSPANLGRSDIDENDPSGDDFNFSTGSNDFSRLNGPENNGRQGQGSPDGIYPNTEDLNGNGNVDQVNAYLEYEIPLDTVFFGKQGLEQNGLVVGGNYSKGWYQLRIPLLDSAHLVTSPTSPLNVQSILQNVQYVRMYLTGFEKPVDVRIADISLVGNQWLPLTKNDSTLRVSVVNIEDNPQYSSPPGVIRERDRTQPDQEIFGNEQSLSLLLNNLPPGESRQAIKYYTVRPLDLFNYKSMKIFVHGDPTFEYNVEGEGIADAVVFMRFGSDTLNFYEYSRPLRSGWDEISIDFEELTSIKTGRTRNDTLIRRSVPSGQRGDSIGVRGNPALTQVRFFSIGLRNTTNYSPPHRSRYFRSPRYLSGEVWVNELRVVDVHNTPGYAYRFDTQFKLSDFGTLGFNFSTISPDFHGLDQRFGSRVRQQNWAVSTNFALDKFLPQDWQGTSLPFGYSHAENISKPKYLPSTDILVEEAATRAGEQAALQTPSDPDASQRASDSVLTISQTLTTRESYAMPSVRIKFPWQIWYVRDILNNFSYRFTYTTSDERSPSVAYRNTWSWDFGIGYSYSFAVNHYYQPFSSLFDGIYLFNDFKDWKLYYFPLTNLSANLSAQRSRTTALNRGANAVSQETRTFNGGKSFGFGWKLTEGGLLNLAGDYGIQIQRDLLFLDNDTVGRDFWSILNSIFIRGRDRHFGQRFTVNTKPKIPNILDIPTYLDLTGGYSVNYSWQNTFQPTDIGKSSGWSNTITLSSNFRLKSLTDPWFKSTDQGATAPPSRQRESKKDTTSAHTDTTQQKKKNLFEPIKNVAKYIIKIPFLDYESINISYNQSNNVANSGVVGSSGFLNFWGRLPFQGSVPENGPSRLYQLGLISDPSGTLEYSPSSKFPFIGWQVVPGVRAPNANLSNVFSQTNKITLRTNRPLWEGATLELSWNLDWTFSRNTTVRTDTFGMPTPSAPTTSGSIGRSFLSIPPVFAGKFFKSNLEDVGKKYEQYKNDRPQEVALTEAFEQGMEALPFLNKVLGQFVPRPNWSLRWNGLEKISGLNSIFQSMQLEHGYTSSFKRGFQGTSGGNERTLNESVNYGFSPLAGVNMGFKELLKGTLGGNFRYSTTTTYDLNLSAGNITETNSKEISLSLTYARRGFEIPLFGLSLKNDIDMTFTFSTSYNARRQHDPDYLSSNQEGTPLEGNTRTTMEPRLRYVLSSRVTAALFYRYTKMKPDEGGSTIPGTTTQEAGLDIHIAIQ